MPDDLYDRDTLAWSLHQAGLLRRHTSGERVNGVDWEHVVEEIEDVGLSQLNAVRSYLRVTLVHLLKLHAWPDSLSVNHWREEIATFQADAAQRFTDLMRHRIDLEVLYARAVRQVEDAGYDGPVSGSWPSECPFLLDQLLNERPSALLRLLNSPSR